MLSRMAHFSRLSRIVVDVPADVCDAEADFWGGALGRPFTPAPMFPEFQRAPLPGDGYGMLLQRMVDGTPRLHLDIHATDRAAEVARLERLGATVVTDLEYWTIMRDPAGLVFCVVQDDRLDETNASAWD
jgi:Glyoxalase-like domain